MNLVNIFVGERYKGSPTNCSANWRKVLIGAGIVAICFTTLSTIVIVSSKKSSTYKTYCGFISNNGTDGWRNEVKISPATSNASDVEYKGMY